MSARVSHRQAAHDLSRNLTHPYGRLTLIELLRLLTQTTPCPCIKLMAMVLKKDGDIATPVPCRCHAIATPSPHHKHNCTDR